MKKELQDEIVGIVFFALGILLLGSLLSYNSDDLPFFCSSPNINVNNWIGIIGAYVAFVLFFLVGYCAYIVPFLFFIWAVEKFSKEVVYKAWVRVSCSLLFFVSCSTFLTLLLHPSNSVDEFSTGGIIGAFFSNLLLSYLGIVGSLVIACTFVVLSFILSADITVIPYFVKTFRSALTFSNKLYCRILDFCGNSSSKEKKPSQNLNKLKIKSVAELDRESKKSQKQKDAQVNLFEKKEPVLASGSSGVALASQAKPKIILNKELVKPKNPPVVMPNNDTEKTERLEKNKNYPKYIFPSTNLLNEAPNANEQDVKDELETSAAVLEETLLDFDIIAKVTQIHQGPTITTYELEPAAGVKVNKIVALGDDIALALKAHSVRIVAPIPGKSCVGIEIPNSFVSKVYLRDVLETKFYSDVRNKFNLPIVLGKDSSGEPLICDLTEMPHLLIAGATGAGKTVCVNTIITSLFFKMHPDMLKMIMIDPKMVEMVCYNDLPHLLCPVVTDSKKAATALSWVVKEMEQRYKLLAKAGVRNIAGYNEKVSKQPSVGKDNASEDSQEMEYMPYLVLLIDELADLMLVAKDDVELAITRLAQLSRAVGIHLILATQRPSVDVITGVIKANLPSRISFRVSSKVDSRTILDMNGADKLLGKGDMLFLKPGAAKAVRAQGAFLSDEEIQSVVGFIKKQREPFYIDEILEETKAKGLSDFAEKDELFKDACKLVFETGQASSSMLQRRFRIGYTRAARLIDIMEQEGIVGPYRGAKPREILINSMDGVENLI